jgi:hypothetical protein
MLFQSHIRSVYCNRRGGFNRENAGDVPINDLSGKASGGQKSHRERYSC